MTPRPGPSATTAMIEEAIEIFDGSESRLARAAGFSQNAVWHARRVGRISGDLAAGIDRATRGLISICRTRPDLVATINATSNPSAVDSPSHAGELATPFTEGAA